MRHRNRKITLGRTAGKRRALVRQLAINLVDHGKIQTTPAKARAVRQFVEPLITRGKEKTPHNIRVIERKIANKDAALKIVNEIGPRFAKRPGGYTRIHHVAPRSGDGAKQVIVEFVEL